MEKSVIACVNHRANPGMSSCGGRGGIQIADALEAEILGRGLPVVLERFYCLGCCEQGPSLRLSPGGEFWHDVRLEDVPLLMNRIAAFAYDL